MGFLRPGPICEFQLAHLFVLGAGCSKYGLHILFYGQGYVHQADFCCIEGFVAGDAGIACCGCGADNACVLGFHIGEQGVEGCHFQFIFVGDVFWLCGEQGYQLGEVVNQLIKALLRG